ncbi:hypothetical protein CRG98_009057 [Punica granatum]|uniref:Reverse transcriptase domain-containing protein n=1 Tax=Punica granatum TaxID=22663 RepID=A0A2I0KQ07_PUNGR|nr:hypothetical protein CRG98_009057 [Punica granatum]
MPFGLTNAPSTFQALMNEAFQPFLCKFVLVFFDDILVYSRKWQQHLQHLKRVFETLREHTLYAKKSKCNFGSTKMEYLGHFVLAARVSTDPRKVKDVQKWPSPKNVKQLRGFLGLTRYYRQFVKGYNQISKPLTDLLKKDSFQWGTEAQAAFETLKKAMVSTPVLALLDFSKELIVETDASRIGIGVVLTQTRHPIAYISKMPAPKHQALSVYERELLAILYAVKKWHPYLSGAHFTITTDHRSLKYLLE